MHGLWSPNDLRNGHYPGVKRVTFEHYRVPEWIYGWLKDSGCAAGKPSHNALFHYRKEHDVWVPACKGGMTVCRVEMHDGTTLERVALCSLSDAFSYQKGRDLSLERALAALDVKWLVVR